MANDERCPATTINTTLGHKTAYQCKHIAGHAGDHAAYSGMQYGDVTWPAPAPVDRETLAAVLREVACTHDVKSRLTWSQHMAAELISRGLITQSATDDLARFHKRASDLRGAVIAMRAAWLGKMDNRDKATLDGAAATVDDLFCHGDTPEALRMPRLLAAPKEDR